MTRRLPAQISVNFYKCKHFTLMLLMLQGTQLGELVSTALAPSPPRAAGGMRRLLDDEATRIGCGIGCLFSFAVCFCSFAYDDGGGGCFPGDALVRPEVSICSCNPKP